jgi:hypothetical protein
MEKSILHQVTGFVDFFVVSSLYLAVSFGNYILDSALYSDSHNKNDAGNRSAGKGVEHAVLGISWCHCGKMVGTSLSSFAHPTRF